MKKIIVLGILGVVLSWMSAHATVHTGTEYIYDNGTCIGKAEHYADLYDRNNRYLGCERSEDTQPEGNYGGSRE